MIHKGRGEETYFTLAVIFLYKVCIWQRNTTFKNEERNTGGNNKWMVKMKTLPSGIKTKGFTLPEQHLPVYPSVTS